MILTIDIGNGSAKFAVFDGSDIVSRSRVESRRDLSIKDISTALAGCTTDRIEGIAISNVVRELQPVFRDFAVHEINAPHIFVNHETDLGLSIQYEPPDSCGPDRLAAAFGAKHFYGAPAIVCDFGTATTIDLVDHDSIYRGGIIAPGLNTMAESLFERTSRLPKVEIGKTDSVVGASTVESIRSGIYFGYLGMVEGIISRMRKLAGAAVIATIATGGDAELIAEGTDQIEFVEPDLIPKALAEIWKRQFEGK
ncbi:MAG: type III pantothenate kinase [Pyrinomonadaceae bacterium]